MIQPASQPYWAESRGGQNMSTYFYCVTPCRLFLLLTSSRGRWNFCRHWKSSVGWILGWDDADAGDYVADISVVLLLLSAEFSWCRFWNWHIFSTVITYYCSTMQAIWKACNFTIYCLKQIYTADRTTSFLWSDPSQCFATALIIALD